MRRSLADRPVVAVKSLLAGVAVEPRGRLIRNVRSINRGAGLGRKRANMPMTEDKPFVIPKPMVWDAWRRVRANKGAPGVDGQDLEAFEADLADNLYKIWNRMSSGSYLPAPGQGSRDPQAARRRGSNAGRADDRRQGRADGRGHASGGAGGPPVCRGLLWLSAGQVGPRRDRGVSATVLEVRLGDRSRRPEVLR